MGGGGNDTGGDWAEMIGEGGGDGRDKNGFRVKPGMTIRAKLAAGEDCEGRQAWKGQTWIPAFAGMTRLGRGIGGVNCRGDRYGESEFRIKSGMTGSVGWARRIVKGGYHGCGKHGFLLSQE